MVPSDLSKSPASGQMLSPRAEYCLWCLDSGFFGQEQDGSGCAQWMRQHDISQQYDCILSHTFHSYSTQDSDKM